MPLVLNGQIVPEQTLNDELLRLSSGLEMDAPRAAAISPESLRSLAVHSVIRRTLLLQAAVARGLKVAGPEIEAERLRQWGSAANSVCSAGVRDAIANGLLVQRISAMLTSHVPRPNRTEAEQYYRQHRGEYAFPESVLAAHIVRNAASDDEFATAKEVMQQAQAELARGRSFAQVANRYSDCKGAGGALGWVARGEMVAEFEEMVFALEPGHRSAIFRTVFGLHIATVSKKRAAGHQPFEDVRLGIAARLFADRRESELTRIIAGMERGSEIYFTGESA